MARNIKYDHNVVVTGSNDGTKQVSKDAWNDGHDELGMFGHGVPTTLTIAAGAIIPINSMHLIDGQGASADNLDNITNTETVDRDELWLIKGVEDITVRDNSVSGGNIFLLNGSTRILDANKPMRLIRSGINWYEFNAGLDGVFTNITGLGTQSQDLEMGSLDINAVRDITLEGRLKQDKGADVTSGGIITLGADGNTFDIIGITTINEILATNWQVGSVIYLQFNASLTVTHNSGGTNDILLGDQTNMSTVVGDVLSLYFNGTDWVEISRSNRSSLPVVDSTSIAKGSVDATKEVRFEVDGNTTGIIGVLATAFTTAKTITFPDATDTLIGKATTDIMTNKSYNADGTGNVLTNVGSSEVKSELLTGQTQVTPLGTDELLITDASDSGNLKRVLISALPVTALPVPDTTSIAKGSVDDTKEVRFEVDGNTAGIIGVLATAFTTAKTITFPDATDTLVGKETSDVFTNKDILSNTNRVDVGTFEIASEAQGDTIFRNATVWTRLPKGTDNQALVATATTIGYESLTLAIHVSGASTDLTDTADIAYLNTINTFIAGNKNTFAHNTTNAGIAVLPVAGNPSSQADGDVWLNVSTQQLFARINGVNVDLGSQATQTPWAQDIDADGFDLLDFSNIEFRDTSGASAANVRSIYATTTEMTFNVRDGDQFGFSVNDVDSLTISVNGLKLTTRLQAGKGIDIVSTGIMTLGADGNTFDITASNTINEILATDWQAGSVIHLQFDGAPLITHSSGGTNDFILVGAVNFQTATGDMLSLFFNGVDWVEISRSVISGAQSPWASDIDANGFDLKDLSNIEFRTSTEAPAATVQAFYADAGGINYNVPAVDVHDFLVDGVSEMTISATLIDLKANNLNNFVSLLATTSNVTIDSSTGGWTYDVDTGDSHTWRINDVDEMILNVVSLDVIGNDIVNIGSLLEQQNATGSLTQDFFVDTAVADDTTIAEIRFRAQDGTPTTQNYARILVKMESDIAASEDGSLQFFVTEAGVHDVAYMSFNDGSGADIIVNKPLDMGANIEMGTNILQFVDADTTITSVTNDLEFDVASGNTFRFRINNIVEMDISNSLINFQNNSLVLGNNTDIRWAGTTTRQIFNSTAGFVFDVEVGDTFSFDIAGTPEMIISSTQLDLTGNNLNLNGGILQFDDVNTKISQLNLSGADRDIVFDIITGAEYFFRINDNVVLQLTSAQLNVNDLSVLVGTGGNIRFGSSDITISGGGGLDILYDVRTGQSHFFRVDAADRMTINELDGVSLTVRLETDKGADIASPAGGIMTLGTDGNTFDITGINTINEILATNWQAGSVIHLQFNGILTVTHNSGGTNDILLGDQTNMTTAVGDVLSLFFNGTDWVEISRSVVGAEVFSWTADHSTNGNSLILTDDATPPAGTVIAIYAESSILNFNVASSFSHRWRVNDIVEMELNGGELNLQGNNIRMGGVAATIIFDDANHNILQAASDMRYNTAVGQGHRFHVDGVLEMRLTATALDLQNNILQFAAGETIQIETNDMVFDVTAGDTFNFDIDGTTELTITETVINAAGSTFQEAGINISPIGTHTQSIPAGAWGTVTTNGAEFAELELATNDIMLQTFNFDQTTSEKIQFWWEPPAEWNAGTITFNVKWTAASGSGTVIWTLAGHSYSNNDAIDAAIGGTPASTTADTLLLANDMHITSESGNVTINGATKGESVLLQLSRDISDTLSADAKLIGINITFTVDEATKD